MWPNRSATWATVGDEFDRAYTTDEPVQQTPDCVMTKRLCIILQLFFMKFETHLQKDENKSIWRRHDKAYFAKLYAHQ